MCGIAGIAGGYHVAFDLYEVFSILQHRGQDAAGMAICNNGKMVLQKTNGLVRDVFKVADLERIIDTMGIGHVRYPTSGCHTFHEASHFMSIRHTALCWPITATSPMPPSCKRTLSNRSALHQYRLGFGNFVK